MEALVTIGACFLLIVLVVAAMRDKKLRLRLHPPAATASVTPLPSASPVPSAAPTASPVVSSTDIQTLFNQGRAESSLIAPVDAQQAAANIDFAQQPGYREIREADLGRIYSSLPKKNRRALVKVAEIGGFRTSEDMARAFGYQSVDQMLWSWDQAILDNPRFLPNTFGTNALPVVPYGE